MASPLVFPQLAGQGWSVHKKPSFSTRIAEHISGREVRTSLYSGTLYEYEVTYDALISDGQSSGPLAAAGANSLQTLLGFYLACQGQFGTFLYDDPTDGSVTAQPIGTGDGATVVFAFQRTLGGFTEPVSYVTNIGAVYVNGIAQTVYTASAPNTITFATAPVAGATITADFSYAFLCRFLDDQQDFENIMNGLWTVSSLKFRSVRS